MADAKRRPSRSDLLLPQGKSDSSDGVIVEWRPERVGPAGVLPSV